MNAPDNGYAVTARFIGLQTALQQPGARDGWVSLVKKHAVSDEEGEQFVRWLVPTLEISEDKALRIWRGEEDRILDRTEVHLSAFLDSHDEQEKRRWTRNLNRAIGNRVAKPYKPEFMPPEDMIDRCLYIDKRDEVVVLPPEWASDHGMTLDAIPPKHFKQMQKGNQAAHPFRVNRAGEPVLVDAADLWLSNPDRQCVRDAMYAIGRSRFINTPNGDLAVNLWSPMKRIRDNADISLFHKHVAFLLPNEEDRERFLDWLAHCEQKPHELPHHGWLMWTEKFGVGRNWLASVLTRVWQGEVAPSLDLVALLNGTFNNAISCKRMAIIDEIHIGQNNSMFTMAARLRQIMTEEIRVINPKYGKMTSEYNATRWLIFSNHEDALPIPEDDRRFEVAKNPSEVKPEAYYAALYKALDDPEFIAGISFFLANRNIKEYNAGARPRTTAAKLAVIASSANSIEKDTKAIIQEFAAAGVSFFRVHDVVERLSSSAANASIQVGYALKKLVASTGELALVDVGRFTFDAKLHSFFVIAKNYKETDDDLKQAARKVVRGDLEFGGRLHIDDASQNRKEGPRN